MLIDLHLIQNHAPANLNRDDNGSPKDCIFGGHPRARISSQCIKRSIRRSEIFRDALTDALLATRSRKLAARVRELLAKQGFDQAKLDAICTKVTAIGSGKEDAKAFETRQTIFCSDAEVAEIAAILAKMDADGTDWSKLALGDLEKELGEHHPRSADVALFGRMTTTSVFEDVAAALQVAHALGTTRLQREYDYYTAVDDMQGHGEDPGADMIGDVEYNSATFYKYFSLSWDDLVRNLGNDADVARTTIGALIRAAVLVNPTGKQNSFAAHNPPDGVLVEVREANIRLSYANAFLRPVTGTADQDTAEVSIDRLLGYRESLLTAYGVPSKQALWLTVRQVNAPEDVTRVASLDDLVERVVGAL